MNGAYRIVLISSGQPSANPRLVKEATALFETGYNVTVIYVPISPWADAFDELLFNNYPGIRWIRAGYHHQKQPAGYKWSRLRRKFLHVIYQLTGDVANIADYSPILFGQELLKEAKKHKADLYIAHNLGALPVAVKAARLHHAKVGFDAEDFHRGEAQPNSVAAKTAQHTEDKYFPQLDYLSAASPLIGDAYHQLYPGREPVIINNVFSLQYLQPAPVAYDAGEPLKLFWFSQTTGRGRGIEEMIEAIGKVKTGNIHCTILGNCTAEMKNYFYALADKNNVQQEQLDFMEPVSLSSVFSIAAKQHIGMALEIGTTLNRQVCLTNKIFTYLLSGLAIIATDTPAQKLFIEQHAGIGKYYQQGNTNELAQLLQSCITDPESWNSSRQRAHELAKASLNWEKEKEIFLQTVAKILQAS